MEISVFNFCVSSSKLEKQKIPKPFFPAKNNQKHFPTAISSLFLKCTKISNYIFPNFSIRLIFLYYVLFLFPCFIFVVFLDRSNWIFHSIDFK